jgi:hypothetical protein
MGYYAQFFWIKMKFEAPPVADEIFSGLNDMLLNIL